MEYGARKGGAADCGGENLQQHKKVVIFLKYSRKTKCEFLPETAQKPYVIWVCLQLSGLPRRVLHLRFFYAGYAILNP